MSEFSKGEWRYDMLPLTADKNIQITIPSKVIALVSTRKCSEEESIANARLIALAPEMYKLLKQVAYGTCDDCMSMLVSARKLIANIDGKENEND